MIKCSRYVLPVALAMVAMLALPALADTIVTTNPSWNGTDTISSFGYPNTATYGEAITTPNGVTNVSSASFWLSETPGFQFQMFIAPWDNNNYLIPGGLAGAQYISPIQTVTQSGLVEYTISGINSAVSPGTIYMFGLTIDNVYNNDAQFGAGSQGGTIFANGSATYYFAWNNDSGNGGLLGANWNNQGCADNQGACGNAAWVVDYNSVPEPGSLMLLGTGVLGSLGVLRRKLF